MDGSGTRVWVRVDLFRCISHGCRRLDGQRGGGAQVSRSYRHVQVTARTCKSVFGEPMRRIEMLSKLMIATRRYGCRHNPVSMVAGFRMLFAYPGEISAAERFAY